MKRTSFIGMMLVVLVLLATVFPVSAQGNPPTTRTERAEVRFLVGMIDHHQMALDMAHHCLMVASSESLLQLCQNILDKQQREINEMRGWLLIWYGLDYHPMSMHSMMQGGMMGGMMDGGMMQGGMMGGMMQGGMMGGQNQGGMNDQMGGQNQGGMMDGQTQSDQHDQHHMSTATPIPMQPGGMGQNQGGMMGGMDDMGMMQGQGWLSSMPMMGMMAGLNTLTGPEFEVAWLESMIEHHQDALHMSERILEVTERPELQALAQRIIDDQTAEIELMETMITELGEA